LARPEHNIEQWQTYLERKISSVPLFSDFSDSVAKISVRQLLSDCCCLHTGRFSLQYSYTIQNDKQLLLNAPVIAPGKAIQNAV